MMRLTGAQIMQATRGRVLVDPIDPSAMTDGITWDSREVVPGRAFLALPGEHVDGNDFISLALVRGAPVALATRPVKPKVKSIAAEMGASLILVDDGEQALVDLAKMYRTLLSGVVIGVTGSSGKTTTKDIIASVVGASYEVVATRGNRNNELGVPATVLAADLSTEVLVVEMGMRGRHQIERLCSFVRPQIGVITNIGVAHSELLGSQENIARAKAELIEALPDALGTAIVNGSDPFTPYICEVARTTERAVTVVSYGFGDGDDVRGSDLIFDDEGHPCFRMTFPDGTSSKVTLALRGEHNAYNALAAAAVGYVLKMRADAIAAALGNTVISSMRQEVLYSPDGVQVINDAYNANPDSMRAALAMLKQLTTAKRRIAVLGDMGELGETASACHRGVGSFAATIGLDYLVTVGELAYDIAQGALDAGMNPDAVVRCATITEALTYLQSRLDKDDVVLVKASRSMELERIVKGIVR